MMEFDVAVVGGGPAGIMAAIKASESARVVLLEKNSSLGKKFLMTGGGRCNITNLKPIKKLLGYYNNKNFLKHSFYTFTNDDLFSFFNIDFHEEDNNRVFPTDADARDLLKVLTDKLKECNVCVMYNFEVISISDKFIINNEIKADKLIIATGGITYPQTGCSKKNYFLTTQPITDIKYGLSPLITKKDLSNLAGVRLYDAVISYNNVKSRGDVLFSHDGISGPCVLDISNEISKGITYNLLDNDVKFSTEILIDFTPDLTYDELRELFKRDFKGKTLIKNYLKHFLTKSFIDFFLNNVNIAPDVQLSQITKKNKNRLIEYLKKFPLEITSFKGDLAKITIGGVDLKFINSKTMESTLTKDLYFAGEVLNLHGPTGGYNLKIAFSTSYLAGQCASKR